MVELPKTEEELTSLIKSEVEKATKELISKHNGEMASLRTKHDADLKKAKEQANLTAEEIAAQKIKEQQEADQQELADLRSYKKGKVLEERLTKENLPNHFKYDTRLLNASEEDFDKVVKDVKKEYEATLPKGNQTSTVVKTSGTTQPSATPTDAANEAFGQVLGQLVGK